MRWPTFFPLVLALVVLSAGCSVSVGDLSASLGSPDRLESPGPRQNLDHWHSVYGLYDCSLETGAGYVEPFQSARDVAGIHSHGDGLIHIHPFFEASAGSNAQLQWFFEEMQVVVDSEQIILDDGRVLQAGTECADGSGPAEIRIMRWVEAGASLAGEDADVVYTSDLGEVRLLFDAEVFIIAFAGAGAEIPPPPRQRFELLAAVSPIVEFDPSEPAE